MKTKEELNALKEEFEALNKKLAELNEEELEQVSGGCGCGLSPEADPPSPPRIRQLELMLEEIEKRISQYVAEGNFEQLKWAVARKKEILEELIK